MPVVFDAMNLIRLLRSDPADAPIDPSTDREVDRYQDRLSFYVRTLSNDGERVIVPTPALAELLVGAGEAGAEYLAILNNTAAFEIAPFDQMAAIEAALIETMARTDGDKRGGAAESSWQKVKFDRQIVAIARARRATAICSDDTELSKHARRMTIQTVHSWDLPLPAEDPQLDIFNRQPSDDEGDDEAGDESI